MILIGSRALALRTSLNRKPVDFDFIEDEQRFYTWYADATEKGRVSVVSQEKLPNKFISRGEPNIECEFIVPGSSAAMLAELVENDPETISTPFGLVPNLDLLFTIKSSHKYLRNSPHFWKTVGDYHSMKAGGAKVRPEYQAFLRKREEETYTYKHPKLNVKKVEFFDGDGVEYVWDHDDIHESVRKFDKPAYRYYMKDGSEVYSDKGKFFALPHEIQIAGVVEEAATLAIERALVPFPDGMNAKQAWQYALSKVCSSITSGWFREFAYENVLEVLKNRPERYWEKFQQDCKDGKVKPFRK